VTAVPLRAAAGSPWWRAGRLATTAVVALCAAMFVVGLVLWARETDLRAERWALPSGWSEDDLRRVVGEAGIQPTLVTTVLMFLEVLAATSGLLAAGLLLRGQPSWFRLYAAAALSLWVTFGGVIAYVYAEAAGSWVLNVQGLGWVTVFGIAFLFPDGRFVPRWTRWVLLAWAAYLPAFGVASLLGYQADRDSVIEILPPLAVFVTSVYAATYRYRRVSTPEERRQTRGLVTAVACWLAVVVVSVATPVRGLVREETVTGLLANGLVQVAAYLAIALVPASIAVAVLRHRLYELDVWVGRALLYAALTLALAVVYGVVAAIGGLLWPDESMAGSLLAVTVLAVLLHPMRVRLQRLVDRFVYGHSLDPRALLADLRRSRERIVVAREDERRRLQRDLHDGLGPTLASLYQRVDAARSLVARDPAAAERLLEDVGTQTRAVIGDIRGLVQALRPPQLDQLGLVGAIASVASRFDGLSVTVSGEVVDLPPVVELAAYRIATEALTNVSRHAQARSACVDLEPDGSSLVVTVTDDGRGFPETPASTGTGVLSMRERADELGGRLTISPLPQGTQVRAVLPLQVRP
jgi:signal transduction histidine kinase